MKNYQEIGVPAELIAKLENAMIQQFKVEVDAKRDELIAHFTSKGYDIKEITTKVSMYYIWNNEKITLKVTACVPGDICDGRIVHSFNNTGNVEIWAYAPSPNYTKDVNASILEILKVRDAYIKEFVSKAEELFLSITETKAPSYNSNTPYFYQKQHGIEGDLKPVIETPVGKIPLTPAMEKHHQKLVKEFESKKAAEEAKKAAEETERKAASKASRNKLLAWAKENGSELLKLRIKHNQNWQSIAETEWAVAHSVGFSPMAQLCDIDSDDAWDVKNATIDQLKELEKAQEENPDHEITIVRMKFVDEDPHGEYDAEVYHKTFLSCKIKTPVGIIYLFKEINDVDDDD